nr:DUF3127 domain-containing protein [Candidatus Karelsulcia muelleri]
MIDKHNTNTLEIKGLVKTIFEVKHFKNVFQKREILLLTEEQYPQKIIIEFIQDKVKILDLVVEGDRIKVFINLKGRKWISSDGTEKYFNSIQGWKIEKLERESEGESESESEGESESESEGESESESEGESESESEGESEFEEKPLTPKKGEGLEDFPF